MAEQLIVRQAPVDFTGRDLGEAPRASAHLVQDVREERLAGARLADHHDRRASLREVVDPVEDFRHGSRERDNAAQERDLHGSSPNPSVWPTRATRPGANGGRVGSTWNSIRGCCAAATGGRQAYWQRRMGSAPLRDVTMRTRNSEEAV